MKRLLLFSLVLVMSSFMAFAGGDDEGSSASAGDGTPQYGGTFTLTPRTWSWFSPDPADNQVVRTWQQELIQETPFMGNFDVYGPRGNNEYDFRLLGEIPEKYMRGWLVESWEVTSTEIIWTVRDGINWAPTEAQSAWMDARPLTAEDIVSDLLYWEKTDGGSWKGKAKNIRAEGNKVIIEFTEGFDLTLNMILGSRKRGFISPPEMLEGGRMANWEDQVGTGPFMYKDHVPDQYYAMEKNPNYWNTTMVDGKEYELPFLDEFVMPFATDVSFETAALRTGTADGGPSIYGPSWSELDRTAPDLIQDRFPISFGAAFGFNVKMPPLDNRDVRRALFIGTDIAAYNALTDPHNHLPEGALPVHWFPVYPTLPSYTPIEEMPEETAILFDYNPELAKKMLADAGYPNGFELSSASIGERTDLLKDQWAKIGVTLNITGVTGAQLQEMIRNHELHVTRHALLAGNPLVDLPNNWSSWRGRDINQWEDPKFDQMMKDMVAEMDEDKRNLIIKEAVLYLINEAVDVPHGVKSICQAWWPWVKNYYGEIRWINDDTYVQPWGWTWIDQDLKKEMGF